MFSLTIQDKIINHSKSIMFINEDNKCGGWANNLKEARR